jgi:hypothetical protein
MIWLIALVGSVFGVALLALGAWIGWRLTVPTNRDTLVGWREFWRRGGSGRYRPNLRACFVFLIAFATCAAMARNGWRLAAPVAGVCVGIGWGAMLNFYVRK